MAHGGKGSAPRKMRNDDAYAENYEKIFGKKEKRKHHDKHAALDELVKLSEELGLYPNPKYRK